MSQEESTIDAIEPLSTRTSSVNWRVENSGINFLEKIYAAETSEVSVSPTISEHLQALTAHLSGQKADGVDFQHTDDFFHEFMRSPSSLARARGVRQAGSLNTHSGQSSGHSAPIPQGYGLKKASPASKLAAHFGRQKLAAYQAKNSHYDRFEPQISARQSGGRPMPSFLRKYVEKNPTSRLLNQVPSFQGAPLPSKYYGTAAYRKSMASWLKLPYVAKHFDHRTTFFPVELKPPPDVDFIPFELYASLSVMVGWQWLIDQYIRADFVTGRYTADSLEIFLADYSLLGVEQADVVKGAIAHYPSEEQLQRMLQYLDIRHRSKIRMRVELLNQQGETVADAWVEYGVMKKTGQNKK